jgi:hypothetical protein
MQSVFSLNVIMIKACIYGSIYSLQMELKGRVEVFPVYGRSRIMDHVTWHGNRT